jgi:hypothetical protein
MTIIGRLSEKNKSDVVVLPGVGLGVGLLAAVLVAVAFGFLVITRRKYIWLLTAAGLGFLSGVLMLVLNVKPWLAPGISP